MTTYLSGLTIDCPRTKQQDHPAIRRWFVQHPLFFCALDEEHRNTVYDTDPFVALEQIKEVARLGKLSFLALRLLLGPNCSLPVLPSARALMVLLPL